MPNYKVLGQANPDADTPTDIYTVPTGFEAVSSTFTVAVEATGDHVFSVAVRPGGATLAAQHYTVRGLTITGPDAWSVPVSWGLDEGTVVTVACNTADVSFGLFGAENEKVV